MESWKVEYKIRQLLLLRERLDTKINEHIKHVFNGNYNDLNCLVELHRVLYTSELANGLGDEE